MQSYLLREVQPLVEKARVAQWLNSQGLGIPRALLQEIRRDFTNLVMRAKNTEQILGSPIVYQHEADVLRGLRGYAGAVIRHHLKYMDEAREGLSNVLKGFFQSTRSS